MLERMALEGLFKAFKITDTIADDMKSFLSSNPEGKVKVDFPRAITNAMDEKGTCIGCMTYVYSICCCGPDQCTVSICV